MKQIYHANAKTSANAESFMKKRTHYNSLEEMIIDLINFLVHYNLYRKHGSL